MKEQLPEEYTIDYVEIYTPMAKCLTYWHTQALGFTLDARKDADNGSLGVSSYLLRSKDVRLVLTSAYPTAQSELNGEIASFVSSNYCGVKRIALHVPSVREAFDKGIENGAIPLKLPSTVRDELGYIEEASIKLYDHNEILFINRDSYSGAFRPGYKSNIPAPVKINGFFESIDHIASEVRINESRYWTEYLNRVIGTVLVQSIPKSSENSTGMILKINQSPGKKVTLVIAEPESHMTKSKVQKNIETFGPGIHHIAFATADIEDTAGKLTDRNVEFIRFPDSYYELLRNNKDLAGMDIDSLQRNGIIIDKEGDAYLLQKFIKPIGDRPFFLYEIVQRVNGYDGFALKNINVLKKAEEMEVMKAN
jgi:4-hydroxyphenylpyruvate dioxygenase